MPRFFLHLRDHTEAVLDPEGSDLPDLAAAKVKALASARDILADDIRAGLIDLRFRVDVENETAQVVHSLPFAEAFTIKRDE